MSGNSQCRKLRLEFAKCRAEFTELQRQYESLGFFGRLFKGRAIESMARIRNCQVRG